MPGLFPGRVVETFHPRAIVNRRVSQAAVREMVDNSMRALTGASAARDAWARLFEPSDVIALKVNDNKQPQGDTFDPGALAPAIAAADGIFVTILLDGVGQSSYLFELGTVRLWTALELDAGVGSRCFFVGLAFVRSCCCLVFWSKLFTKWFTNTARQFCCRSPRCRHYRLGDRAGLRIGVIPSHRGSPGPASGADGSHPSRDMPFRS